MKDKSMLKVKVLMAKQFTDDEKIILAGIDTGTVPIRMVGRPTLVRQIRFNWKI
jgi:hypothetical protein